jgi:hypothetical protein
MRTDAESLEMKGRFDGDGTAAAHGIDEHPVPAACRIGKTAEIQQGPGQGFVQGGTGVTQAVTALT